MILQDIRVIDLSSGIAGAYLSRLFVDAGADVIRVETEAGVGLRRRSTAPVADGHERAVVFVSGCRHPLSGGRAGRHCNRRAAR